MRTKSAFASKGVWGGIVATVAGIISFVHTIDVVGVAQAVVDNWPGIVAAGGGILAAYGRIRASVLIAPKQTTGALSIIAAASLASGALALQSCAQVTPALVRGGTALAVSNTLQYGVEKSKRAEVAKDIAAAGSVYTQFSGGTVPTVDQFHAALDLALPNNESKAITESNLIALYSANYDLFKSKAPQVQIDYLTAFLLGASDGAAAFVSH